MDGPFDARRSLLEQRGLPQREWRIVSLVTALRECIGGETFPAFPGGRSNIIRTVEVCADELTRRGVPADPLIRYGMLPELISGVLEGVVSNWLEVNSTSFGTTPSDWAELLEPVLEAEHLSSAGSGAWSPEEWKAAIGAATSTIATWVFTAPLADLIRLTPPTSTPSRWVPRGIDDILFVDYRWCIDRFSITSVADWTPTSVEKELAWRGGEGCAPCEPKLMADRVVQIEQLQQLSEMYSLAPPKPGADSITISASLSYRMQNRAADLLQRGEYAQAGELFRFALSKDPEDATAANNLGFCLIPLEPETALQFFDRADDLGFEHLSVLAHNRMVASMILGREVEAIGMAEARWMDERPDPSVSKATLWSLSSLNGVTLKPGAEPRLEVARLAVQAAKRAGTAATVTAWTARAASVA